MKPWIAVVVLAVGCGGKKEDKGGGGGGGGAAKGPPGVAAWMPKDAESLWQGAWFTRMNPLSASKKKSTTMAGDPVAVEVKGTKATVTDGTAEVTMDFALSAPCEARFTEAITEGSMKGGSSYHDMMFVVQNGALVVGSGAGGYRKDKTAIVCSEGMQGGITIVDDKGCKTWSMKFDKWESKDNTCVWSQAEGKDLLTIGTGDWTTKVTAEGDVLTSEQFRDFVKYTKKAKDYADAKAQMQAEIDAKDPSKKAIKAGGVVGKTDTIVSFNATWGSDKSLKGKPFEITALYLNTNTMTSNGEKTHNIIVVDKVGDEFTMACNLGKTEPPGDLKQGDKVTVKGTVDESFDKPELNDCTVSKAP
jgi:hypothetical protein